jgi:hypothetical protein
LLVHLSDQLGVQHEIFFAYNRLLDFPVDVDLASLGTITAENPPTDAAVMSSKSPIKGLVAVGTKWSLSVRNPLSSCLLRHCKGLGIWELGGVFSEALVNASVQILRVCFSQKSLSRVIVEVFDRELLSLISLSGFNPLFTHRWRLLHG